MNILGRICEWPRQAAILIATVGGCLVLAAPAYAQDNCKDILANGIWDYSANASETRNVKSFLNWYGSIDKRSSSSTKKQLFTTGGTYYGISGDLGLSNDETKNQEFLSRLETLNTGYDEYDAKVSAFVKSASSVIVKAWKECMTGEEGGVHASVKFTDNPTDIIVDLRFVSIDGRTSATVEVVTPDNMACDIPHGRRNVTVPTAGMALPCKRKTGEAGAITLNSNTKITPERAMLVPSAIIRPDRTGQKFAGCDVIEEIKNGKDTLEAPETMADSGSGFGGGTPAPLNPIVLEAPFGYVLTSVAAHCKPLGPPDSCHFVHGGDNPDIQWTIPSRRAELHPTSDGPPAFSWLTGARQKISVGIDRNKHPVPIALYYGKNVGVEFPNNALDVKLYCNATGGQRIFSLSDIQKSGEQLYLKAIRTSPTGRIMDMAVLSFELNP